MSSDNDISGESFHFSVMKANVLRAIDRLVDVIKEVTPNSPSGQGAGPENEKSPCKREWWQSVRFLVKLMDKSPEFTFRIYSGKHIISKLASIMAPRGYSTQHLFSIFKYILLQRTTIIGLT